MNRNKFHWLNTSNSYTQDFFQIDARFKSKQDWELRRLIKFKSTPLKMPWVVMRVPSFPLISTKQWFLSLSFRPRRKFGRCFKPEKNNTSLSGDLGIGLVWDNHPPQPPTFWSDCWNPLQTELNYLWWVLSCSQDDIRCFPMFSAFSDVSAGL